MGPSRFSRVSSHRRWSSSTARTRARSSRERRTAHRRSAGSSRTPRRPPAAESVTASTPTPTRARSSWSSSAQRPRHGPCARAGIRAAARVAWHRGRGLRRVRHRQRQRRWGGAWAPSSGGVRTPGGPRTLTRRPPSRAPLPVRHPPPPAGAGPRRGAPHHPGAGSGEVPDTPPSSARPAGAGARARDVSRAGDRRSPPLGERDRVVAEPGRYAAPPAGCTRDRRGGGC